MFLSKILSVKKNHCKTEERNDKIWESHANAINSANKENYHKIKEILKPQQQRNLWNNKIKKTIKSCNEIMKPNKLQKREIVNPMKPQKIWKCETYETKKHKWNHETNETATKKPMKQ